MITHLSRRTIPVSRTLRLMLVDAWIQHPTPRMLRDPMFDTLRRWSGQSVPDELPIELTLAALDAAKIDRALITAWSGPEGFLVTNDGNRCTKDVLTGR